MKRVISAVVVLIGPSHRCGRVSVRAWRRTSMATLVIAALVTLAGCATPGSVTRKDSPDASIMLDVPIETARQIALDTAIASQLNLVDYAPDSNDINTAVQENP